MQIRSRSTSIGHWPLGIGHWQLPANTNNWQLANFHQVVKASSVGGSLLPNQADQPTKPTSPTSVAKWSSNPAGDQPTTGEGIITLSTIATFDETQDQGSLPKNQLSLALKATEQCMMYSVHQ